MAGAMMQNRTGIRRQARCAALVAAYLLVALVRPATVMAAEHDQPSLESVQAVLTARCAECHNQRKRSGQLNLATAIGLARGGESGHVIVAGDLDDSLLWQRIDADDMPPEAPLGDSERLLIRGWISAGAHGLPAAADVGRAGDGADHWAFQPAVAPPVPNVRDESRVENDVDRFVQAKLEERGLTLGPEASRATLIRRVSFDVTGLPPTPDEVEQFVGDDQAGAYQRMVERYLASPHYGERWGRHWLDAAGYADSNGYFNADTDRPLAYRYRDYVIRSLNDDKPLDRFLTEQLAGDELAGYRPGADVTPDVLDLYIATHFLRNSQDGTDSSDGNPDELLLDRFTVLEGTIEIIGQSLLGLTLQCARCHDHKFEPITQREYYQLQAIFYPAYCPDQWVKAAERTLTVGTHTQREEHAAALARIDAEIAALNESLAAAARPLRERLIDARLAALSDEVRAALESARDKPEDQRSEQEQVLLNEHQECLEVNDEQLDERFGHLAEFRGIVQAKVAALEAERPAPLERVAVLTEVTDDPPAHHVLLRGVYKARGDEVAPGVPAVLCRTSDAYTVPPRRQGQYSSGRRLAFARWLTDSSHPLLARVTVNRIWQNHFGQGLVASSDNFGYTGSEPTHPELVDYLATHFVECGWSLKELHRLILCSRVYRQTSAPSDAALAIDPHNMFLWRYPLRRLDAESLRDAILAASGLLDNKMYGPYVPTERQSDGSVVVSDDQPGRYRRSLYLQQRRTQLSSLLEVFDAPIMVTGCARRPVSTVPLQSLELLNGSLVMQCAESLAARLADEAGDDQSAKVLRAFLLTTGRQPSVEERGAIDAFIASQSALYAEQENADSLVWRDLCQMLLASNSFLYVE